ncbi:hypothetical protein K439DRAFT_1078108 [Ramaria rubella]|nr:hypothetical protein K439DRAFT_1078108 [Ramaria rubella]
MQTTRSDVTTVILQITMSFYVYGEGNRKGCSDDRCCGEPWQPREETTRARHPRVRVTSAITSIAQALSTLDTATTLTGSLQNARMSSSLISISILTLSSPFLRLCSTPCYALTSNALPHAVQSSSVRKLRPDLTVEDESMRLNRMNWWLATVICSRSEPPFCPRSLC